MSERQLVMPMIGVAMTGGDTDTMLFHSGYPGIVAVKRAVFENRDDSNLFNLPRTMTLSPLIANSEVVILDAGTETERTALHVENSGTSEQIAYTYTGDVDTIDVVIIKPGYEYLKIEGVVLGASSFTLPIDQQVDRAYAT